MYQKTLNKKKKCVNKYKTTVLKNNYVKSIAVVQEMTSNRLKNNNIYCMADGYCRCPPKI